MLLFLRCARAFGAARLRIGGVALLALALAAPTACSDDAADAPPTATVLPATTTPAGPPPTATPDPALLRDGGIAIIELAYNRILDEYINPRDHAPLLADAWTILSQEAAAAGLAAPAQPAFSGDRTAAFATFRAAYVPLAARAGDPTKLRYGAIRGMAQGLVDCHTFFLSPVSSTTLVDARAGKGTVGIGVELAGLPPLIIEVVTGSPADRAGVLVGDRIAAIDGADASGLGPAGAFDLINGDEGSAVRLRVRRASGAVDEMTITRARVRPPNVDPRTLDGNIGYVRVRNFVDGGIYAELRDALTFFESRGVTSWIIDLRGNPGGRLDTPAASLFVPEGAVVMRTRGRDGVVQEERATGERLPVVRPTVLLTDQRTGSVAEVFAAALKEHSAAYLVGANTNGCVGFTDDRPLGDGSSLAVTTHVNIGPVSGTELNGVGIAPHLAVPRTPDDIANARDPQLDAAIAHLQSGD
jgi:carboxyl-terminal processing protease